MRRALLLLAVPLLLTACGGDGDSTVAVPSLPPTTTAPPAEPTTAGSGYVPIDEPFDIPVACDENGSTLQLTSCVLEQVVEVDKTVDRLQAEQLSRASSEQRAAVLAEQARWLRGRGTTCAASADSGGTLDQVTAAQCLLQESRQRVVTLHDVLGTTG